MKYVYTVRPGAKFSDGSPVTAADVAYTFNLQLDPKVGAQEGGLFTSVKSVTASGNTMTVNLKHPDSLVKYLPASIAGFVYEQKSVAANLANYGTPQALPVGAGPYMVSQYAPDSQITLVRNPYYYGPKPKWDTIIIFKGIPSPETLLLALRSGEIDGTFSALTSQASQYSQFSTVDAVPLDAWSGLTLDMSEAPFNNINVRKALYYATADSAGINKALGAGFNLDILDGERSVRSTPRRFPRPRWPSLSTTRSSRSPSASRRRRAALAASPVPHRVQHDAQRAGRRSL